MHCYSVGAIKFQPVGSLPKKKMPIRQAVRHLEKDRLKASLYVLGEYINGPFEQNWAMPNDCKISNFLSINDTLCVRHDILICSFKITCKNFKYY